MHTKYLRSLLVFAAIAAVGSALVLSAAEAAGKSNPKKTKAKPVDRSIASLGPMLPCAEAAHALRAELAACFAKVYGDAKYGPVFADAIALNRRGHGGDLVAIGSGYLNLVNGKIFWFDGTQGTAFELTRSSGGRETATRPLRAIHVEVGGTQVYALLRQTRDGMFHELAPLYAADYAKIAKSGKFGEADVLVDGPREWSAAAAPGVEAERAFLLALRNTLLDSNQYATHWKLLQPDGPRPTCNEVLKRKMPGIGACLSIAPRIEGKSAFLEKLQGSVEGNR